MLLYLSIKFNNVGITKMNKQEDYNKMKRIVSNFKNLICNNT